MAPIRGITDYAKDTVLALLQEFFSNEKNVGDEFLFNRDLTQSRVLIADKYTINLEDVAKKPSIVVIRGAQSWSRRGIDQHLSWEGPGVADRFTDLIMGSFNCTCMSAQGLEAESLAHATFAFFQFFRKVIRNKVKGVHDIASVVLGEEQAAVTDSQIPVSVVPVQISLLFQWTWKLEQAGPVLKDVDVNTAIKNGEDMTKFLKSAKPVLSK